MSSDIAFMKLRAAVPDEWSVTTVTKTVLTSEEESICLHGQLDAWEGEERVYSENWSRLVPRGHV